jgi:amino acid adenylation domain-containing protein/non-ribosomal peptide synthase protein (TIGR01720 family)
MQRTIEQEILSTGYPLSLQQKRIWQLQSTEQDISELSPYWVKTLIHIREHLQLQRLQCAIEKVIDRHEILRTRFHSVAGLDLPLQGIDAYATLAHSTLSIQLSDLRHLPPSEQLRPIKTQFEIRQYECRLDTSPLLHVELFQTSNGDWLILRLPALCADTSTLKQLVGEISYAYAEQNGNDQTHDQNNHSNRNPNPDSNAPLQYVDISTWQDELLSSEEGADGQSYWQCVDWSQPFPQLPFRYLVSTSDRFQPHLIQHILTPDLSARLQAYCTQTDAPIAALFLTCWQTLLWRLSNGQPLVIGVVNEGRTYEELKSALGALAKTLPLTCHLDKFLSVEQLLSQTTNALQELDEYQEYFAGHPDRPTAFLPIAFEWVDLSATDHHANFSFRIAQHYSCIDRFHLKLVGLQYDDRLSLELHYDGNVFEKSDIHRVLNQFLTLLQSAFSHPDCSISTLELLGISERQQLLVGFNQTQCSYPDDRCLHQLFQEQVAQTPNAIAVTFQDKSLTYAELNTRSNHLAHHLQQFGIGSDSLVGLYVNRSLDMLVGLLGILKAGGAYVPLDPSHPPDRLAWILTDLQAEIVITQQSLADKLSTSAQIICLDRDWDTIAQSSSENPVSATNPDHLAYVIYTSGSTGKPKGTLIPHRGLVNYLTWATQAYEVAQGTGTIVHSSLAFDLTITSLLSPLLVGRTVELLPSDPSIETLSQALSQRTNLSLVKITPAHLELLNQTLANTSIQKRSRALIIGGEALLGTTIQFWQTAAPDTRLVNEYGPTETVVGCCVYTVSPGESISGAVPIGQPIANTQLYVLDVNLQPVPIGVVGELFIGGVGLARGYLNRPDLTAEKFVPHPFSDQPGERLYRTGDLARYRSDGTLEYLGRIDTQVKIKGFRVELSEVEATLSQHPAVRESVVVVRTEQGRSQLVAYLVCHSNSQAVQQELRGFLRARLPEPMVPSQIVVLPALPLTTNGKVDRAALPNPEEHPSELNRSFAAPQTLAETRLVQIWEHLLNRKPIGIHDNFFELGGDSILSIQVIAKAKQAGLEFTPKQLFQYQTIAELVTIANTAASLETEQGLVTGSVRLTPIQNWFFEQNFSEPHHWNQSLLLEVAPDFNASFLPKIIQHLLDHHDALRLQFSAPNPDWHAMITHSVDTIPITQMDLSGLPPQAQIAAIEQESTRIQASLDLGHAPLMRVVWFDRGENQPGRLLIAIHHLVVDGVSWRILLEDFQTAYYQLSQEQTIQLPAKTTSFKGWSDWLQSYAKSVELQREQAYWLAQAERVSPPLPVDFPDRNHTLASACTVSICLTPTETQALLQEVPAVYHTQIEEVLLTAVVQAFAAWTGHPALRIDLERHGRDMQVETIDVSRTFGWFTALFPAYLDINNRIDAGTALQTIKEQLRQIPRNGIGYGIMRYLQQDDTARRLQAAPKSEVCFNYLGQIDQSFTTSFTTSSIPSSIPSSLIQMAAEPSGASRSVCSHRPYLLEINGMVRDGQLRLHWLYSNKVHQQQTIETLAHHCLQALRSLIQHCQSPQGGGYTPADFPAANISSQDLNKLLTNLSQPAQKHDHER